MKILLLALLLIPGLALAQKHEHSKNHKAGHNHDHKDQDKKSVEKAAPPAPVTSPSQSIVTVNGMVCAFCAQGLEKKFKEQKEVDQVQVDLDNKKVVVGYKKDQHLKSETIKTIIKESGFEVVKIDEK